MAIVLLVEDQRVLADTLRYNLEREGHTVVVASDGVQALELARRHDPALIILDVMLPLLDGFSVCCILRTESNVPIMMLTARQDEVERIAGLELGADDYVVKPFSLGEVLARVRAMLRRGGRDGGLQREVLQSGDLKVDLGARRVWHGAGELMLSAKEFDLLACLMRNCGMALGRDLLLERVWGFDFIGDPRTVDVHIRWLREKIETDPSQPLFIRTVRGTGYRFQGPANTAPPLAGAA